MPSTCLQPPLTSQHPLHSWLSAALALAGAMVTMPVTAQDKLPYVKTDLQVVSTQRIFFGHQSVGDNLLDGVRQLAKEAQLALNIVEVNTASAMPARSQPSLMPLACAASRICAARARLAAGESRDSAQR